MQMDVSIGRAALVAVAVATPMQARAAPVVVHERKVLVLPHVCMSTATTSLTATAGATAKHVALVWSDTRQSGR
jgi:hypothetical protein